MEVGLHIIIMYNNYHGAILQPSVDSSTTSYGPKLHEKTAGDDGARMLHPNRLIVLAITGTPSVRGYYQVNFTYNIKFCLGNSKWHQFQQRH